MESTPDPQSPESKSRLTPPPGDPQLPAASAPSPAEPGSSSGAAFQEPAPAASDDEQRRRIRRYLRRTLLGFLILIALGLIAVGLYYLRLRQWSRTEQGPQARTELRIDRGSSLNSITDRLVERGLIDDADRFRLLAVLEKKHASLQAGDYVFSEPLSPLELLERLQHGTFERSLTIPEGWTAARIEDVLVTGGWVDQPGEWISLVARPVPVDVLGFALPEGAEGFCFPETYQLDEDATPEEILARMLRQFARVWGEIDPGRRDPRSESLSPREAVILASMIQREARSEAEMPDIASVYLNRLQKRMRLQCCATIHYALGEVWNRPLLYKDLEIDSPYNTYKHYGLPPGPIGNPGRAALEAVLRPARTDYLFYVYRGDGTHEFTRTYREHQRAARKFRKTDPNAALQRKNGNSVLPPDLTGQTDS